MPKKKQQSGQSLVEYALAAALCLLAVAGALVACGQGLDHYWDHLCLLMRFPNP
jgi:Flp pilus assembly pilin Flp